MSQKYFGLYIILGFVLPQIIFVLRHCIRLVFYSSVHILLYMSLHLKPYNYMRTIRRAIEQQKQWD
jgi:hypothetical protein